MDCCEAGCEMEHGGGSCCQGYHSQTVEVNPHNSPEELVSCGYSISSYGHSGQHYHCPWISGTCSKMYLPLNSISVVLSHVEHRVRHRSLVLCLYGKYSAVEHRDLGSSGAVAACIQQLSALTRIVARPSPGCLI